METLKRKSLFQDLKSREINGFRVRKRPFIDYDWQDFHPIGALAVEHEADPSPPMAVSYCKTNKNAHILALADEGGYVTLFNTRQKFHKSSSYLDNAEKSKVSEWVAHSNAIFDVCWIKVRLWSSHSSYSYKHSPLSTKKRVIAIPRMKRRQLFMNESSCAESDTDSTPLNVTYQVDAAHSIKTEEFSIPESQKKKGSFSFDVKENLNRTPKAEYDSPSSVLYPPSSLKRKTIRDYFSVS